MGFSKNPLVEPKNSRRRRSAILKIVNDRISGCMAGLTLVLICVAAAGLLVVTH